MFHRRRASNPVRPLRPPVVERPADSQALNAPPSANATTAAAQAFLASRASNASLASAAAGAALRSHTTSPTPVAQVQTKRNLRRQSSNASSNSGGGSIGQRGPAGQRLQRQGSSGSMSERTFRDPSPNGGAGRGRVDERPPVPALPDVPPAPAHRRTTSLQPPARVTSPALNSTAGRPLSLDRGPAKSPGLIAAQRVAALASVQEQGLDRVDSKGSVNFSRPNIVRTPPPVAGRPPEQAPASSYSPATSTTSTPVKKKKKKAALQPVSDPTPARASPSDKVVLNQTQGDALLPPKTATAALTAATRAKQAIADEQVHAAASPGSVAPLAATAPKKKKKKKAAAQGPSTAPTTYMQNAASYYNSDLDSIPESGYDSPDPPRVRKARAPGTGLVKQPSIVREDREREEQEDNKRPALEASTSAAAKPPRSRAAPRRAASNAEAPVSKTPGTVAATKRIAAARQHERSASQPHAGATSDTEAVIGAGRDPGAQRSQPALPGSSRVAHFSVQPPLMSPNVPKHQPPPRSVSPAKSALKTSPSPSRAAQADQTPSAGRGHRHAPSEASDLSVTSEETAARKKANRVSFDERPLVVSTGANEPGSPVPADLLSPQHKQQTKRMADDAEDAVLQPRPALPSFGSVRNRKERDDGDEASSRARMSSPPESPVVFTSITGDRIALSNDHAVGGILQQDHASRAVVAVGSSQVNPNEPLPPQVRSVEGSGELSEDEASVFSNDEERKASSAKVRANGAVPNIALTQPTPVEEQPDFIAGPAMTTDVQVDPALNTPTPASLGIAEPDPEVVAVNHSPTHAVTMDAPAVLRTTEDATEDEDSETDESLYDDAAEDLAEGDGEGFMSLDAVVESPVVDTTPGLAVTTPPDSPLGRRPKDKAYVKSGLSRKDGEASEPAADEGWDKAQEYWSNLSDDRKKELEQAAQPGDRSPPTTPTPKRRKKKKVAAAPQPIVPPTQKVSGTQAQRQPLSPRKQADPSSAPTPPLKSSLRSKQKSGSTETHMARTMRDGPAARTRRETPATALAQQPSTVAAASTQPKSSLKKSRPASAPALEGNPALAAAVSERLRNMPARASVVTGPTKTKAVAQAARPQRAGSNASDSSAGSASSFVKARSRPSGETGFFMKRTMRGASQPPEARTRRPGSSDGGSAQERRYSLRTASPSGSSFRSPSSALGKGTLRGSARNSTTSNAPSLRPKPTDRTKSPSRFSSAFGRSTKSKRAPAKASSRPRSRFTDSSDDDDDYGAMRPAFRSRFSDSSDDDGPSIASTEFTPVRGIPRRTGEEDGESTDLPDSSDGDTPTRDKPPPVPKIPPGLAKPATPGSPLARLDKPVAPELKTLRTGKAEGKKRSFLSVLGRRKGAGKVQKAEGESGARLDTPLERTKAQIRSVKTSGSTPAESPATPTGPGLAGPSAVTPASNGARPKLVKKSTSRSITSNNWPLPPTLGSTERPATSDGNPGGGGGGAAATRPDFGRRRVTATGFPSGVPGLGNSSEVTATAAMAKKKKFPRLRKAFGLHD